MGRRRLSRAAFARVLVELAWLVDRLEPALEEDLVDEAPHNACCWLRSLVDLTAEDHFPIDRVIVWAAAER